MNLNSLNMKKKKIKKNRKILHDLNYIKFLKGDNNYSLK